MRRSVILAGLCVALPVAASARIPESPAVTLAGRVAGPPRQCLSAFERDREAQTFKSGDVLYRGRGSTWFLNHPDGCPRFDRNVALVTQTPGQLCRGDIVQVIDPVSGIFLGSCPLGDFVPYEDRR